MTDDILKGVLKKFTKNDFAVIGEKWGKFSHQQVDNFHKLTKASLVSSVIDVINENYILTPEDVWQLDLIYMNHYPAKKSWTLYNFSPIPGKKKTAKDPTKLAKVLRKEINFYFKSDVSVRLQDNVTWVRIGFHDRKQTSASTIFMAYVPSTNYFFMTPVRKTQLTNLVQGIMIGLDGHSPTEGQLRGRNLYALLQLLHNKTSEVNKGKGSFGSLRDGQQLSGPLSRKRKIQDEAIEWEPPEGVVCEDQKERYTRRDSMLRVFGPAVQPALEKVEYSLKTPFKAKYVPMDAMDPTEPFDCHVTFSGTNVIEGIKKLGQLGIAERPIPAHLREIHMRGQNRFSIKPKHGRDRSVGGTPRKA